MPLLIVPKGWTPSKIKRQGRDELGRRVQRTYKRHETTGKVNGFEHETAEGRQHSFCEFPTVSSEVRPSDFGMTKPQLLDLLAELKQRFPTRRAVRRNSGLVIPGEDITWR